MRADILRLAAELEARGEPFALATVVRREAPSSARSGDVAIVTADGAFHGWVGGTCTRPTVIREAKAALADGAPRLIALSPDGGDDIRAGVRGLPMTCHSGGSVDVHIDPVLPAPVLYVLGVTPAARALADLGAGAGFATVAVDPEADEEAFPRATRVLTEIDPAAEPAAAGGRFVVVATQGQWDEAGIRQGLALEPEWIGVVASRKRFGEMRALLEDGGVDPAALDRVEAPAGVDIGAVTPAEIAVSVLAGLVRHRRGGPRPEARPAAAEKPETAKAPPPSGATIPVDRDSAPGELPLDPVCHMRVEPAVGVPSADYQGGTYWFCCGGCREKFLADPERYLETAEETQ
jgi:xanthine dehydrogenase accessory factor